jgi:predicted ATPase/DNA-binding XRE family transcriptional regulator
MKVSAAGSFGIQLKALREVAGFTQEELATIAGLSVHAVSALERGERRRPQVETVRALSSALDLTDSARDALLASARARAPHAAVEELASAALPAALTALIGREADVEALWQWHADHTMRLITLTGPGGAGKTRLALELVRGTVHAGLTRVVFVPLAAVRDPGFVAPAIAQALGLADVTARDLPTRARVACEDRSTLLVLDNFEHVLDAAPLVADLLTSVALLRVLITSRAPLRLRGEREYVVGPLALPVDLEPNESTDQVSSPAVRLFVERVREVQPDFRLTSANERTVTAICRRLDALPLALELAAPWMKVLSAEELLRRLEHDVLLSSVAPRDLPERQQTMNATVAWSYQLLEPGEQRAFRRFGVLPGRFPIDAAEAVLAGRESALAGSDEALRAAADLIDKSLLLRVDDSVVATCPLYHMLETVRAYAVLELDIAGEYDDAMEGLVRYCTAEAALAAEGLVGPAQAEWLDRVQEDRESYRAVLTWLIERGRPDEASDIAWALMFFWMIRGHAAEGLRWYSEILNLPYVPPAAESRALVGAALMWFTQGELSRARAALTRAHSLAVGAGDMDMVVRADDLSARVEHALGNLDGARERFIRAIEGFEALGIPWGVGNAQIGMAAVSVATGDVHRAEQLLDEATPALQQHAGPWFVTRAMFVRSILALRRGNPDDAMAMVRDCLTRIRELQDKFALVYALVPLAAAAALKGNDTWAARILGARDAVAERTGATIVLKLVHELGEQAERGARARLGPDRWALAYAAGRTTSLDSLLEDVDKALSTRAGV